MVYEVFPFSEFRMHVLDLIHPLDSEGFLCLLI